MNSNSDFLIAVTWSNDLTSNHPDFYHAYQPDEHVKLEPQQDWVNEIMRHRVTRFPSWNKGVLSRKYYHANSRLDYMNVRDGCWRQV